MSPETYNQTNTGTTLTLTDEYYPEFKSVSFSQDAEGIIPHVLKTLKAQRNEYKGLCKQYKETDARQSELYNLRQLSCKVVMNTFYGLLGQKFGKLFIPEIAIAITQYARNAIKCARDVVSDLYSLETVYIDTDSTFIKTNTDLTASTMNTINTTIQKHMNCDTLVMENEGTYDKFIAPYGVKKCYYYIAKQSFDTPSIDTYNLTFNNILDNATNFIQTFNTAHPGLSIGATSFSWKLLSAQFIIYLKLFMVVSLACTKHSQFTYL